MIQEIDSHYFEQQLRTADSPVLVEFYAARCHPCQEMLPILEEVGNERTNRLQVFKFDAGSDPEFASRFRIATVPNLILFFRGSPIAQRSGFTPKRELLAWIDSATPHGNHGTRTGP